MAPKGTDQRVDELEAGMATIQNTIRTTIAEDVSAALKAAVAAMEHALANRFLYLKKVGA